MRNLLLLEEWGLHTDGELVWPKLVVHAIHPCTLGVNRALGPGHWMFKSIQFPTPNYIYFLIVI